MDIVEMLDDDDDVVMFEEFLPSQCYKSLYVFYPSCVNAEMHNFVHGKWLLFVPKGKQHDKMWQSVKQFMKTECTYKEVVYAKASTSCPNSHVSGTQLDGVIMIHCSKALTQQEIISVGVHVARVVNYTSPLGKMYYKTEEQSKFGSTAHSLSIDEYQTFSSFFVDVPVSVRDTAESDMQTSGQFQVKYCQKEFAKQLGAVWDNTKQSWVANDDKTWNTMIAYFPQKVEVNISSPRYVHKFCVFSLNIWAMNVFVTQRMRAILQCAIHNKTDVLMLQEVTAKSLNVLAPLLKAAGFSTKSVLNENRQFCEMLYYKDSTFAPVTFKQTLLQPYATAGREFHELHAIHKQTGKHVLLATAHLETGLKGQLLRARQFAYLQVHFQEQKLPWIFGGDTNMAYYQDDKTMQAFVADAWKERGYAELSRGTWNPIENSNIKKYNPEIPAHVGKCRYDRFLFQKHSVRVHDFFLSCTDAISDCDVFPSDHFAIVSHFSFL